MLLACLTMVNVVAELQGPGSPELYDTRNTPQLPGHNFSPERLPKLKVTRGEWGKDNGGKKREGLVKEHV